MRVLRSSLMRFHRCSRRETGTAVIIMGLVRRRPDGEVATTGGTPPRRNLGALRRRDCSSRFVATWPAGALTRQGQCGHSSDGWTVGLVRRARVGAACRTKEGGPGRERAGRLPLEGALRSGSDGLRSAEPWLRRWRTRMVVAGAFLALRRDCVSTGRNAGVRGCRVGARRWWVFGVVAGGVAIGQGQLPAIRSAPNRFVPTRAQRCGDRRSPFHSSRWGRFRSGL